MTRLISSWLAVIAWGCSAAPSPGPLPAPDLAPSLVEAPSTDVGRLARTDDCIDCHGDVGSHWMHSAHAYASFDNPWYRASIDSFRTERGRTQSRFCAGCHDPLLLVAGRIDEPVSPDDDLAYAGITCLVCHGIESATPDGNASYTLSGHSIVIPDPAAPDEIDAHRTALSLKGPEATSICGSCHRSFTGRAIGNEHHLPGIDDLGDWASSAFAGAALDHLVAEDPKTCRGCHMSPVAASEGEMARGLDGRVSGHRWAASHTALAAQLPDGSHLQQAEDALVDAVTIDIGPVRVGTSRYLLPEEARLRGGERLVFDVVMQSHRVGHRFPGGVRDLQNTWVEVSVQDGSGAILGVSRAGPGHEEAVFVLRATMLDEDGQPESLHGVHRFRAPAFDRTLAPHDAMAVRYSMQLPDALRGPLRVEARLLHRKHRTEFAAFACEASRTERGIAFARGALRRGKVALDPCLEQPTTEVGRATTWIGKGADSRAREGGATRPTIERLLGQGLALLHANQEHVHLARRSIERARRMAEAEGSSELEARALALKARLLGLEGRPDRAAAVASRAEALVGRSAALDRIVADAYARVWRWRPAIERYERVVEAVPGDFRAWQRLARAYGSVADDRASLRAADAGLRLAPRDEHLLRSRALALEALGDAEARAARRRWLAHRNPDSQPSLLARCEEAHQRCRRDRQPIPHYTLAPPMKGVHASLDPG